MNFITKLLKFKDIFSDAISIQVLINHLIKKRHLAPYYNIKKEHLVRIFIYFVVRTYGLSESIISDRGPQFMSEFWQCLYKRLGIKVKLLTVYHLETEGQFKRVNQAMKMYLQSYVNYIQDDWAECPSSGICQESGLRLVRPCGQQPPSRQGVELLVVKSLRAPQTII